MAKKIQLKSVFYWGSIVLIPLITLLCVFTIWQWSVFESDVQYQNALYGCPVGTSRIDHPAPRSGNLIFGVYTLPSCEAWLTPVFESLGL